jgi:hypothetical protein
MASTTSYLVMNAITSFAYLCGGFSSLAIQPTASVFIGSTGIETFSKRRQVAHSKVRCSKPNLPGEIRANPILCLQVGQDGRSAIEDTIRITLPQSGWHQSRAPTDRKKYDQHHYDGECKPPNGEPVTPTARRPVAPAPRRNVAGVIHLSSISDSRLI